MAAAPPETNGKTRGEAIIKRRDGSLEIPDSESWSTTI